MEFSFALNKQTGRHFVRHACIQAAMISTHGQQGVSFVTDGINLKN